jgi:hypothetical protein
MRLSDWRGLAPNKGSVSPKVLAVVETALISLGAGSDPDCWIAWGDDPSVRYLIFAPTPGGLVQVNVRVNVAGEGTRAAGKVVRWTRVQLGELGVEIQGGHRLVTFQVETQVLNGVDDAADRISDFAQALFAAVDGRPAPLTARPKSSPAKARTRTTRASAAPGRSVPARSATTPASSAVAKRPAR